jgi:drug/metabolite transporter (DMT)-like permease
MSVVWVPVTLVAAVMQILRTSAQHELRATLSTSGAAYVRYLYGAPLGVVAAVAWFAASGRAAPSPPGGFWVWVTAAGIAQILGTIALLQSFRTRDFAVGTVYAKTEVIQVAMASSILLGEPLRLLGWAGAAVVTVGVALLAGRGSLGAVVRRAGDPAALLGIAAGGLFGLASIGIRGASTSLGDAPVIDRALLTLALMLTIQATLNGAYLAVRDRTELVRTLRCWRSAAIVGVLSLAGSAGWAIAMTLENAAKVRTLGQVELVLAFLIAWRRHGERHTRADVGASVTVLVGVALVASMG